MSRHASGSRPTSWGAFRPLVTATAGAALVVITWLVYLPVTDAGYVFDDDKYLTENPLISQPGGLGRIWFEPSASQQYYPLVFTTYWIEYRMWGLDPLGYHLVNVLLHGVTAILLWRVLRYLGVPGAWLAAAIFAVHPVHVESVAWIVERKNTLSGCLALASLLAWLRHTGLSGSHEGNADNRQGASARWGWFLACMVFYLGGLLSKSVVCVLPVVLALIAWWKRGRLTRRDLLTIVPMLVLGAAAGLFTSHFERTWVGATGPEFDWGLAQSLVIAGRAVWFYLGKLLLPIGLGFIYPRWDISSVRLFDVLWPVAGLVVLITAWLARKRIGPGPFVAVAAFVVILAPALGFFKIYAMRYSFVADHWQYHANMAMIALLSAGITQLVTRLTGTRGTSIDAVSPGRMALTCTGAALLIALGILTFRQSRTYHSWETFWEHTARNNPGAWMAQNYLGTIAVNEGNLNEAIDRFEKTIALQPNHYKARTNLAVAYIHLNKPELAVEQLERAVGIEPGYHLAHNHLGVAYIRKGDYVGAIPHLRRALELSPGYPDAHEYLAIALEATGDRVGAIEHYRLALRGGDDPVVMGNLAWVLATAPEDELRDGPEAVRLATGVIRSAPTGSPYLSTFWMTLAAAHAEAGQFERAVEVARSIQQAARRGGADDLERRVTEQLILYEQGLPWRHASEAAN